MSLDFTIEADAVIARLAPLCGGRVRDGIPDDAELEKLGWEAQAAPYLTVRFGMPRAVMRDRSITHYRDQPHALSAQVTAWGASPSVCRAVIAAAIDLLVSFRPSEGASEVEVFGGGDFRQKDSGGRTSRFAQQVGIEFLFNLQTDTPTPTP